MERSSKILAPTENDDGHHLGSRLAREPDRATAASALHVVYFARRCRARGDRLVLGQHHPVGKGSIESADGRRHLVQRSEEHTSELQSPCNLVCRLLLEKK